MNKENENGKIYNIIAVTALFIGMAGVILLPIILTQPAFLNIIDFSEKEYIGNVINGTTAPLIGLVTAFLMYIAFRAQYVANQKQWESIKENQQITNLDLIFGDLDSKFKNFSVFDLNEFQSFLNDITSGEKEKISNLNSFEQTMNDLLIFTNNFSLLFTMLYMSQLNKFLVERYRLKIMSLSKTEIGKIIKDLHRYFQLIEEEEFFSEFEDSEQIAILKKLSSTYWLFYGRLKRIESVKFIFPEDKK